LGGSGKAIGGSCGGSKLVALLDEGARVEIVRVDAVAVPPLRLTLLGEKLQEMPTGWV